MLFQNCLEHARVFLKEEGYIPTMLSDSRLNRRLHGIAGQVWLALFQLLGAVHQQVNDGLDYIVDSLPITICDNYRIPRCRLYRDHRPAFRGYGESDQWSWRKAAVVVGVAWISGAKTVESLLDASGAMSLVGR